MIRIGQFKFLIFICIIFKAYSLSSYHFRCADGRYILDRWFCDGSSDCPNDKSDENYGCDNEQCGRGSFKCADGTCLNITVRCNTLKDCPDGSDETKCGDETEVKDCLWEDERFLCDDKLKCIDLEHICDGYCNCLDCSDEISGCAQYDDFICDKCSDTCYKNSNDTKILAQKLKLTPCQACRYDFSCEHTKCVSVEPGKQRCICDENYEKNGFNRYGRELNCRNPVSYENVIIYSTPNEVKLFNLTTNKTTILHENIDCTALASVHDYVYYAISIDNMGRIYNTSISSGTRVPQVVLESDSIILSIAIDWMTYNIYYTTNTSIMVCSKDGRVCTELRSCMECRVKLSPKIGLMFWSENGVLFQSDMDGSNERNFTNDWELQRPDTYHTRFFFTVDESTDIVYWTQNFPFIKWTRLYSEGSPQEVLLYGIRWVTISSEYFDLEELDNSIFFTLENNNTIYCYNESAGTLRLNARVIDEFTPSIKNIRVHNRLLQRTKIPNPCDKAKCSLCLLKPFTPFIGLNYVCKCENVSSTYGQFSCEDDSREKSKIVPDATARKRDIYDVNNPPFTWGDFFRKIKTIIILAGLILICGGVYFGVRKWKMLKSYLSSKIA